MHSSKFPSRRTNLLSPRYILQHFLDEILRTAVHIGDIAGFVFLRYRQFRRLAVHGAGAAEYQLKTARRFHHLQMRGH